MTKTFYDVIHRTVPVSILQLAFIDTPEFQRLRRIKQLGCASLVFHGATHTRFEHSIGTGHLARKLLSWLASQQPDLGVSERTIDLVALAGTLHDVGHGPFSHLYDEMTGTDHEDRSCALVRHLAGRNRALEDEEIRFVCDVIKGEGEGFLYQIVNNRVNGFDVDKWDYLVRDAHMVGFGVHIDYERIIRHCKVIGDTLCYHAKIYDDIFEVYRQRHFLHRKMYNHNAVICIEMMVKDCLMGRPLGPLDDDSVLYKCKNHPILRRIEYRQLYTVAGSLQLQYGAAKLEMLCKKPPPSETTCWSVRALSLWGCSNHPMENIPFFSDERPRPHKIKRGDVSKLFSPKHNEIQVRLICKIRNEKAHWAQYFERCVRERMTTTTR